MKPSFKVSGEGHGKMAVDYFFQTRFITLPLKVSFPGLRESLGKLGEIWKLFHQILRS